MVDKTGYTYNDSTTRTDLPSNNICSLFYVQKTAKYFEQNINTQQELVSHKAQLGCTTSTTQHNARTNNNVFDSIGHSNLDNYLNGLLVIVAAVTTKQKGTCE